MDPFIARVAATIARHGMLRPGERVVAGVSGGADSVTLARILTAGSPLLPPIGPVAIAHVEHGIRGEEAGADARFVEGLARDWGVPFLPERARAPARARREGISLEVAARRARLEALERAAGAFGASAIALGHGADDDAETILLRIVRGTGLRGLAGIAPVRPLRPGAAVRIVRPLIDARRDEIRAFLASEGIPWREDRTNRDPSIPRNRVRLEILPLLAARLNPSVHRALRRLGRTAGEAWRALREEAEARAARALRPSGTGLRIDLAPLEGASPAVLAEVAAMACRRMLREKDRLRSAHIAAVLASALGGRPGSRVSLPEGWEAARVGPSVLLVPRGEKAPPEPAPLPVPGAAAWAGWRVEVEAVEPGAVRIPTGDPRREYADLAGREAGLALRGARPGDRFHPLGGPGHMKLAEFLRAQGVPARRRAWAPVLAAGSEILWVVGRRIAEPVRIRRGSTAAFRLRAVPRVSRRASGGSPG